MKLDKNVVFLTGPADLIVFMAGLVQIGESIQNWIVALIGGKGNIPVRMLDCCAKISPSSEIHFVDFQEKSSINEFTQKYGSTFKKVAITHLVGKNEDSLLSALSWEELIVTENGIATHILPESRSRFLAKQKGGRPKFSPDVAILPLSEHKELGCPKYLEHLSELCIIGFDQIIWADLCKQLRVTLGVQDAFKEICTANNVAIVAGTSLYRAGIVDFSDEVDVYETHLSSLSEPNNPLSPDLVVWKPHPRMMESIQVSDKKTTIVTLREELPLELWLPTGQNGVSVYSTASTTLLTARLWHNLNSKLLPLQMNTAAHPHIEFVQRSTFENS